jgi:predicted enzyme related to lactoylglutathione lyase
MRRLALFTALVSLLLLTACGNELPPSPPPPGGSVAGQAIAGMAAGMPSWAAQARYATLTPLDVKYGDSAILSVTNYDYVYSSAYLFNSNSRTWERFDLSGKKVQSWIEGGAVGSIDVSEAKFAPGMNFVVVYGCTKIDAAWECNGNKWMLLEFNLEDSAAVKIPESANLPQIVVSNIMPFKMSGTLAEYDEFGGHQVDCIRYDAKYTTSESGGLTVLVHVFDFENRDDVMFTAKTFFGDIIKEGWKFHSGNNLALFQSVEGHRIAVWTSGKKIIYVQTYGNDANKEVIDAYLKKYPSDLVRQ